MRSWMVVGTRAAADNRSCFLLCSQITQTAMVTFVIRGLRGCSSQGGGGGGLKKEKKETVGDAPVRV